MSGKPNGESMRVVFVFRGGGWCVYNMTPEGLTAIINAIKEGKVRWISSDHLCFLDLKEIVGIYTQTDRTAQERIADAVEKQTSQGEDWKS